MEAAAGESGEGQAAPGADQGEGVEGEVAEDKSLELEEPASAADGEEDAGGGTASGQEGGDGKLPESLADDVLREFAFAQGAGGEEEEEEEEGEEDDDEDVGEKLIEKISKTLTEKPLPVRVHDITIVGNTKTKDSVIEAQLEDVKRVETMQELIREAAHAKVRMQEMGIFDKCLITLDAGPAELPHTANVVVEVEETKRPFSGDVGFYSKPEKRNWSLEGALKWKNILGYGETWDGTGCYGLGTTSEVGVGLNYPRFRGLPAALQARASHLTQDFSKGSSYRERLMGFSVGLLDDEHHDISYNLTWRDLRDPSRVASQAVRQQLGHFLLSSIKYSFKLDRRNSALRPTKGFAFVSSTQVAGLGPDSRLLRFIRQEFDFRWALPLGFYNAALNFGVAGGLILPWGPGFMHKTTPISDRFFMGGHSSLLGELRGPSALPGFRSRGVGPSDQRRPAPRGSAEAEESKAPFKRDTLGGDLAMSTFADLSFDLPIKFCRDYGIHGHSFVCGGNLVSLTGANRQPISVAKLLSGFRCCAGLGIVIPTKLFRLEVNYCQLLRVQEYDRVRRGFQISLSSPY